ncbi:hypothetical protein BELL_0587g00060 [Botrytis elliptica]|uniref:Synaptobrevin n=1 Tax=Botrytis elliptica TaxID=278938 RepID=A0A4Z1JDQ2_9HELO|nr:hypothetical protein EAE99_008455 [Botrytis elliptica]TGO71364.1 hypothetical protein BELL_0587g00060 [Botrytis elliptica]
MARLNTVPVPARDPTATNLERMLVRLQKIILGPDTSATSQSYAEWVKMGANLEYARGLLVHVEQDAQNIKVLSRKQEVQADLVRKRHLIQRLSERLEELRELAEYEEEGEDSSEGEDLLGIAQDTPSETTDEMMNTSEERSTPSPTDYTSSPIVQTELDSAPAQIQTQTSQTPDPSTLRSRNPRAELFEKSSNQAYTTSTSTSTSTYRPAPTPSNTTTATTETLLTHHRTEQEDLTNSLLSMAQELRARSQTFASTLASDSSVLDSAIAGINKNELGLEAASKRMGYLRSMTEGKGWWGRMMMYAWIAGLAVLAVLVVFVMPKLRF